MIVSYFYPLAECFELVSYLAIATEFTYSALLYITTVLHYYLSEIGLRAAWCCMALLKLKQPCVPHHFDARSFFGVYTVVAMQLSATARGEVIWWYS